MKKESQQLYKEIITKEYDKLNKSSSTVSNGLSDSNALQLSPVKREINTNEKTNYKLSEKEKEYILQSAAEFKSNTATANKLNIHVSTVLQYQKRYSKDIQLIRKSWLNKLSDVPFKHKRIRLEQYQFLYQQMLDLYVDTSEIKDKININRRLESLLDKSRLEIEGNKHTFEGFIKHEYDDNALLDKVRQAKLLLNVDDAEVVE